MPQLIYRKGFALEQAVAGALDADYHSTLIQQIKDGSFSYRQGRIIVHLAREFGFCYGVDRAVDYAYQARRRFPDQTVYLTGEIIHNPHVNDKLRSLGIRFLSDAGQDVSRLGAEDVVIIPAFGVTVRTLEQMQRQGCTLVDTTCGSVLNVWKNVRQYARDGYTAVIHGKIHHEETQATASQALQHPDGRYLVVLNRAEALEVCNFIRNPDDSAAFLARFGSAASEAFDPDRDLGHIGLANQTTMLMSESLEIAEMFRHAMRDRYGEACVQERFRAFETICSATQDRQDAVVALLDQQPLDLMLVIGGYNSSNTCNLARICANRLPTFHIAEVNCLVSAARIRHRRVGGTTEIDEDGWLPASGPVVVGVTAGASTPDNIVGQAIERLAALANGPTEV
ncbi:MAG TPA: 4-hydroxy-3-methylbut-2-enyl diphosphate reductase [Vicinamibacterales bacterium]|jgi:4-hydroxy-3-methylbut-2-enyl diphosphate reductase